MEDRDLTITLELHVAGDSLTGRAVNGAGPERKFFGRLGLLSAIELLLADSEARHQGGRMATIDTTRSAVDSPRSSADTLRRLRAVKAAYDPADLFLANHPVK